MPQKLKRMTGGRPDERATLPCGDSRGALLAGTIIILAVTGIIGFSFLSVARYENDAVGREYRALAGFWHAEEALSLATAQIKAGQKPETVSGSIQSQTVNKLETFYGPGLRVPEIEGYVFAATACIDDDTIQVCSISVAPKHASGPLLHYRKPHYEPKPEARDPITWARIMRGRDEPPRIYFSSHDTIGDGSSYILAPELNVAGSPVFGDSVVHGKKNGSYLVGAPGYPLDPVFKYAPSYRDEEYSLDHVADRIRKNADIFKTAGPGSAVEIELDGRAIRIRRKQAGDQSSGAAAYEEYPLARVKGVYVDGDIEVRGTLAGRLTLGARGNIRITGDLRYQGSNPVHGRPDNSGSLLGLIAGKNVQIAKPADEAREDGGIIVNAAIIAQKGAFETINYMEGYFGVLRLWGSVTEYCLGMHGHIRPSLRRGYTAKVFQYDPTLRRDAPPLWPPLRGADGSVQYRVTRWTRKY